MTNVLFVQGAGDGVHDDWDRKLVDSLRRELGPGYDVRYPRMPDEADPQLETWRPVLERELAALGAGGVVVGHSVGGTLVLHVLGDSPLTAALGAIALIALPFVGKGGWESAGDELPMDLAERMPAHVPIFLYHGEDDATVPVAHVDRYAALLPRARVRRLAGRDHQLNDDLAEVARDIRATERS
jgi:predicted alpha/beta hydrolase family esterase